MAKEFNVPVGTAFDKRLAELVWESCSKLAQETVAGKLAMTVEFNSREITVFIVESLVGAVVEQLKPKVLEEISTKFSEESLASKLSKDVMITNALVDVERDLGGRVNAILKAMVANKVKHQVELIIDHELGSDFTAMVQEQAKKAIESHVERRLGFGKPGVTLNRAEEEIRQMEQGG